MRALLLEVFNRDLAVVERAQPRAEPDGIVVHVEATGLCRSDWHNFAGHDPELPLPHVLGHEFAGTVVEVGSAVTRIRLGDRVTTPFACACGECATCRRGLLQVCERVRMPGVTDPGSFAEYVAVPRADRNVVTLPDSISSAVAATLGCRFATSYHAVVARARVVAGERVCIVGCGGVGLAAIMVAVAEGAEVIAVDPSAAARDEAAALGAHRVLSDASDVSGCDVSIDAYGAAHAVLAAIGTLRQGGRHVQLGLLYHERTIDASVLTKVTDHEIDYLGSQGMPATEYPAMLARIVSGELDPARLIGRTIGLDEVPAALATMSTSPQPGITVVTP